MIKKKRKITAYKFDNIIKQKDLLIYTYISILTLIKSGSYIYLAF